MNERVLRGLLGLSMGLTVGCYEGTSMEIDAGGGESGDETAGTDGGDSDDTDGDGSPLDPLGCGDDMSVSALRRLSAEQYRNTVRDLFAPAGIDAEAEAETELDRVPVDDAGSTFGLLDGRVSEQHVRAYYRVADVMALASTSDDAMLAQLAGDCATEASPSDTCIEDFIDAFGLRAYRRPLTDGERQVYVDVAAGSDGGPDVFRSIVFRMLQSPDFLYHVQVDGEGDDEVFDLGPYALASRLSYHFWGTMPDDALLAAAADGSLATDDGYLSALDRVFEDPRTQARIDRFYDEWLQLGWLTAFPESPAFATLAEGSDLLDPDADHLEAAQEEIHAMTRYYTYETDGSLADLLLSERSFTTSPYLAALYGVEAWDGQSEPPMMPEGERSGLLTRMAFLVTGSHETHPVHRGAVVRRRILCEELPAPDPSSLPPGSLDPPPTTDNQTTRERYEAKTADAACAGCHDLINPVGFVLERYDAVGRLRTEERVIDEETGEVIATLPIDSNANPALSGDNESISTGLELSQAVLDSQRAEACFAKQYFRASFGRVESDADACTVEAVQQALTEGQSIREALRAVAITPAFRARRVF